MRSAAVLLALLGVVAGCGGPVLAPATVVYGSVAGTVVVSPCRPVERVGDPPCPPRPGIVVTFQPLAAGGAALTAQTDAGGHYSLRLPAGDYDAKAAGGIGGGRLTRVAIPAGGTVTLDLVVDSGIR